MTRSRLAIALTGAFLLAGCAQTTAPQQRANFNQVVCNTVTIPEFLVEEPKLDGDIVWHLGFAPKVDVVVTGIDHLQQNPEQKQGVAVVTMHNLGSDDGHLTPQTGNDFESIPASWTPLVPGVAKIGIGTAGTSCMVDPTMADSLPAIGQELLLFGSDGRNRKLRAGRVTQIVKLDGNNWIETDIAFDKDDMGAPLLDESGAVVGVAFHPPGHKPVHVLALASLDLMRLLE